MTAVNTNKDSLEIIDINLKGNVIELKLGKNGSQWGDDWNDKPYNTNASEVYTEYVDASQDVAYNSKYQVKSFAQFNNAINPNVAMIDFVNHVHPIAYVVKNNTFVIVDEIYLGDTIAQHPLMHKI